MNSSMVTEAPELIPSRFRTVLTVSRMIFQSPRKVMRSTYFTSQSNFSSQLMAFLPRTCARPVKPGLT